MVTSFNPACVVQAMLAASAVRPIDRLALMALFWLVHDICKIQTERTGSLVHRGRRNLPAVTLKCEQVRTR